MKTRVPLLLLLAVCVSWADQVTLKNGDRVTGAIVKKDGNTLTLKSDLMGVVTIPWDQVTEIKSTAPLSVTLAGQTAPVPAVIKATVASSNGQITLSTTSGAPQTVAPANIATLRDAAEQTAWERLLHPGLFQLWTGTATLGLAGTAGNSDTSTFTMGFNSSRATNHDVTSVYFNAVKSSSTVSGVSSDTAQAVRGGWKYSRKTGSRLDVNAFNDYEYDKFQNLSLRFVAGGGLGYRAWKGKKGALGLQGGFDYDHDSFFAVTGSPAFSRASGEAFWGDDFSYKATGATSVVQSFRMFNNITIMGAYRANFDVSANTKISKWLVWNLAFGDRYVSDPVAGRKPNDILYTTGIGVTFGH